MNIGTAARGRWIAYPITALWLAGTGVAVGVAQDIFDLGNGLILLTVFALAVLLVAVQREIRIVHHLVNSQRDMLLARIDALVESLTAAGIDLPPGETRKANHD